MGSLRKKIKIKHDIRGRISPSALLISLKEINVNKEQLQNGLLAIEILTDNRDAVATIPSAVEKMGYRIVVDKTAEYYTILIDKEAISSNYES